MSAYNSTMEAVVLFPIYLLIDIFPWNIPLAVFN